MVPTVRATTFIPPCYNCKKSIPKCSWRAVAKKAGGKCRAFPNLNPDDKKALITFLFDKGSKTAPSLKDTAAKQYRYVHNGWTTLTDQDGLSGVKPPWGTLNAIDLNNGSIVWRIPLGEYPELIQKVFRPLAPQTLAAP